MAESQTKIAQELTPEELAEFCNALLGVPHAEMAARIQAMALERGISIGKSAAYEFKNKEALPWIKRIQARKEKAKLIAEVGDDDSGRTLADAAAAELGQIAFDLVSDLDGRIDLMTEEGQAVFDVATKGVARIRKGDRDMIKQLQQKVTALEQGHKTASEEIAKLRDPETANNPKSRQAVLDAVDEAMGIKKKT